jgi:VWFA-related protein
MAKLAAGLLVVFAITALAQDQGRIFRTEANYVHVDVFPTTRGVPVADLKQEDFELLEDKVPQKIDAFEHFVVRGNAPEALRREPRTVAESRAMLQTTHGRVFVLFLDFYHVEDTISMQIRQPMINSLDRLLADGDLLAVMTPGMRASDLSFTAKTGSVAETLSTVWGHRDRVGNQDPEDANYKACYPGFPCPGGLADELIDRRREKMTLDALEDLVQYLRGVREERTAVLAITDGWRLFEPNEASLQPVGVYCKGPTTGTPAIGVDPRTGRFGNLPSDLVLPASQCEIDRGQLLRLDNARRVRDIGNEANRANVSFYPIDPRGLVASDQYMQSAGLPDVDAHTTLISPRADAAILAARLSSLRTLALDTDGTAIVATNDIAAGLRKVAEDLSSYYLLGYYSTGKLDGKFHAISVRVKRPGVDVRARRGYLASTARATEIAPIALLEPAAAARASETAVIAAALAPLGRYSGDLPMLSRAVAAWRPDGTAAIWTEAEFTGPEWKSGGQVDVTLIGADRQSRASAHVELAAGVRSFTVQLKPSDAVPAGDYSIVMRARAADTNASPSNETLRFVVPPAPEISGAVFLRRGPTTGNKELPTADARFRRTDQIRVEIPTTESAAGVARLLDRTGKTIPVPVQASVREDADGTRWRSAQLTLAPLAPGDYVIEIGSGASAGPSPDPARALVAFRVIP